MKVFLKDVFLFTILLFCQFNSYAYVINNNNKILWEKSLDTALTTPLYYDKTIYLGGSNGLFYAFNETGSLKWSTKIRQKLQPIRVINNVIYGVNDHYVCALNTNGEFLWEKNIYLDLEGDFLVEGVVGSNGIAYVITHFGELYAINVDGKIKWKAIIDRNPYVKSGFHLAFAKDESKLYISNNNGNLFAYALNGNEKWHIHLGGWLNHPHVDQDHMIYITNGPQIFAIDKHGIIKWDTMTYASAIVLANTNAIYATSGNDFYAIQKTDGHELWRTHTHYELNAPFIDNNANIYAFERIHKYLIQMDKNGKEIGKTFLQMYQVNNQPAIGNGCTLYFSSDYENGELKAIDCSKQQ